MPTRAPKLCPRCLNTYRATRCETCTRRRDARQPLDAARNTDYGSEWAKESKRYLAAHPLCECAECEAQPEAWRQIAREVDHIDGLGPSGPRGFDWANLQALSKSHHSRKTALQDGGFGNPKRRVEDLPGF